VDQPRCRSLATVLVVSVGVAASALFCACGARPLIGDWEWGDANGPRDGAGLTDAGTADRPRDDAQDAAVDSRPVDSGPRDTTGQDGILDAPQRDTALPSDRLQMDVGPVAVLAISPPTVDFGVVTVGDTGSGSVTVTNVGDLETGLLDVSLAGADAGEFAQGSGDCQGRSLASHETCSVQLVFRPTSNGAKNANIVAAASPAATASAVLTGSGRVMVNLRVDLVSGGNGPGVVASTPVGINCGSSCSADSAMGSTVSLSVSLVNGAGVIFAGWSGDGCSGPARTCSLTMDHSRAVTATFADVSANVVFATSVKLSANLGGFAPYDAKCNQLASAAGLNDPDGSAYVAWLSDDTTSARTRLGSAARGFVRVDGLPVADDQTSLFGSNRVFNAIRLDEWGNDRGETIVMTGTWETGEASGNWNCAGWTSTSGEVRIGSTAGGPWYWTDWGSGACFVQFPVVCFMTRRSVPVAISPSAGKRIFLDGTTWVPGGGTSAADARCESGKPPGTGAVRALLATTTTPASAVLNLDAAYVRPDGQIVGTGRDLVAGTLVSGAWQYGSGTYFPRAAWTGATSLDVVGTPDSTCHDWTSSQGAPMEGASGMAGPSFWKSSISSNCSDWNTMFYCVEQ
jgi:hypothetical protein